MAKTCTDTEYSISKVFFKKSKQTATKKHFSFPSLPSLLSPVIYLILLLRVRGKILITLLLEGILIWDSFGLPCHTAPHSARAFFTLLPLIFPFSPKIIQQTAQTYYFHFFLFNSHIFLHQPWNFYETIPQLPLHFKSLRLQIRLRINIQGPGQAGSWRRRRSSPATLGKAPTSAEHAGRTPVWGLPLLSSSRTAAQPDRGWERQSSACGHATTRRRGGWSPAQTLKAAKKSSARLHQNNAFGKEILRRLLA